MWCNFKYYYFRYPKPSFVFQFFHIYVSFRMLFYWTTTSHFFKKVRAVAVQIENGISVKTYATVPTRNFLILPLLTTAHYFLYVHIRFRTFRTVVKPNWNNYYTYYIIPKSNETDILLTLLTWFVHKSVLLRYLFIRWAYLPEWKLFFCSVLWRVYARRIHSLIAKDLKFDWSV